MRITAFLTDTAPRPVPGQVAGLELRHRQHARVEDRIRETKATGLRNLPCRGWDENAAWLEVVLTAVDLVCWTKTICFANTPTLARCEIATFRYRILQVAAETHPYRQPAAPENRQDLALGRRHRRRVRPATGRIHLTSPAVALPTKEPRNPPTRRDSRAPTIRRSLPTLGRRPPKSQTKIIKRPDERPRLG